MTTLLPLLESCSPRPREQTSEDYAADLHKALQGEIGNAASAADFFAGTHATPAMHRVATGIFDRLKHGSAANQPAIIRFNSMFGGGKTHTLIALAAAAKHPQLVRSDSAGGMIPANLAVDDVKLVCFTGENANLLDGMAMDGTGRRAKSLVGFLAYHLGGEAAFDSIRRHDDLFSDPGADDIQRLIGDQPTLILLDELVRWVAAAKQLEGEQSQRAANGLRNALTAISKAVANSPHAVMVITTPEEGHDAYRDETQFVHNAMNNLDSVTARTARDFTPTETADVPAILRRRLFQNTGTDKYRLEVAQAYAAVWRRYNPNDSEAAERFYDCYPFHPETLRIIAERLASNNDFQRVRGVLRAMSAVIHRGKEIDEPVIHPHHLDVGISDVQEELVNRTKHQGLYAAIFADVIGQNSTAQRYGSATRKAANVILLGSLAPTANNGLSDAEIVNALLSPSEPDNSVAMQAVQNIKDNGLYIDDDPSAGSTRFNQQANVRREVEQRANTISETDRLEGIGKAIKDAFYDKDGMGVKVFPSRPNNVPDDPNLVHVGIVNPSHVTMQSSDLNDQLDILYRHQSGSNGNAPREYRNNVAFLVPDHEDLTEIKQHMARHKAASAILEADTGQLLGYQRDTLISIRENSRKAVFQGIQRNWVNLYYPEPSVQPHGLQQARLQFPDQEGRGQNAIIDFLTGNAIGKMAHPRNPALDGSVWASAGLDNAADAGMTVGALHGRFARTPGRKMFLKRAHFDRSLDQANEQVVVVVRTPTGLEINHGSGVAYKDDMQVWLKEHAPQPGPSDPSDPSDPPDPGPVPDQDPDADKGTIPPFEMGPDTGQVVVHALITRMTSDGLDWADIARAAMYGSSIALLNDMASKAQSNGVAAAISYEFEANGFEVRATSKLPEQWQQCSRACAQMERAAGTISVNAEVVIVGDAHDAVRTMLHDLDNTHQVQLDIEFRQPDA